MATAPVNNDLPLSNGIPGTYVKLDLTGSGAAADNSARRLLVLGYRTSSATYGPDTPVKTTSQTDCNTYHGRGSDVSRLYAAAASEVGPGALEMWTCGVAAPSGAASRYEIIFLFSTGATAATAGAVNCWIAGHQFSIGVTAGDALGTIGAALVAAIAKNLDIPLTAISATTTAADDTVRMTYRVNGAHGEDLPIKVNVTGVTNLKASPGALTFATPSIAVGSCITNCGGTTITSAIAGVETAVVIATSHAAAINGGSYPLTCTQRANPNDHILDLWYATDRDVRRVTTKVVKADGTANDTTVNAVAAGSYAYLGTATFSTPGSGNPTITTALTNIGNVANGFGAWVTPWAVDQWAAAPSFTHYGSISTHIETQANGYNQKGQVLFIGAAEKLANAALYVSSPSPALTASPRYAVCWCLDSPQQAYEHAARCAALYLDQNYAAQNFDGKQLVSKTSTAPMLVPAIQSRPNQDNQNAAMMSYYLTPVVVNSNSQLVVLRGRTTSNDANQDLWEWSTIKQLDAGRSALRTRLVSLFSGKSIRSSAPKSPNTVTVTSIKDAIFVFLSEQDDQDLFDDAAAVKDAIAVTQNPTVKTRCDIFVPWNLIRALHQLGATVSPQ